MSDLRYSFMVEWFDQASSLIKTYILSFYPKDNSIDMVGSANWLQWDVKNKRVFLSKVEYPSLQEKDLYLGSVLSVYSRQLKIVDYADVFTRKKFEIQKEK